jgi:hypothetical protein
LNNLNLVSIKSRLSGGFFVGGGDLRKFEPKKRLKFEDIDKSIQELRAMFKVHPEWFDVPKPKSDKGRNEVDYPIKND